MDSIFKSKYMSCELDIYMFFSINLLLVVGMGVYIERVSIIIITMFNVTKTDFEQLKRECSEE